MKKTNKKLTLTSQTIRELTANQMSRVGGGVPPNSELGSGCLSCRCQTKDVNCTFQCPTAFGQTCATTCL